MCHEFFIAQVWPWVLLYSKSSWTYLRTFYSYYSFRIIHSYRFQYKLWASNLILLWFILSVFKGYPKLDYNLSIFIFDLCELSFQDLYQLGRHLEEKSMSHFIFYRVRTFKILIYQNMLNSFDIKLGRFAHEFDLNIDQNNLFLLNAFFTWKEGNHRMMCVSEWEIYHCS